MTSKKLKVENWPIDKLIPYARNPRKNDQAVEQVAAAIKEFGFRVPIVAKSDGLLVDGHLRLKAAQKLGLKEVPVVLADDLSDAQIKAFRISVNRMAELAEWDNELLALEFAELKDLGFDTSLTGFDEAMVSEIMPNKSEPLTDEDAVPEVDEQAPPKTKIGDVWILGNHKIMCGDSTDEAMVAKLMNGVKADMLFTDPPYGVNYDGEWRKLVGGVPGKNQKILNDDKFPSFLGNVQAEIAYIWHAGCNSVDLINQLAKYDYELKSQIIWKKPWILSKTYYNQVHEPCFYAVKKGCNQKWIGSNKETTVWELPDFRSSNDRDGRHPMEKPTKLCETALSNHDVKIILDLFLGSGSTLIACEKTGRKCYGMELSPQYIEVIIRRWQEYTGKEAHLEETGETFNSIASR